MIVCQPIITYLNRSQRNDSAGLFGLFLKVACNIFDNMFDNRNNAWLETEPRGAEAIKALRAVHEFTDMMANSMLLHVKTGAATAGEDTVTRIGTNFGEYCKKPSSK